jgi:hypothetical protein
LLAAAGAIRRGGAPVNGLRGAFRIQLAPRAALAGTFLSNEVAWHGRGQSTSVIYTTDGQYSQSVLDWVGSHASGQGSGPFVFRREQSERRLADEYLAALAIAPESNIGQLEESVARVARGRAAADILAWASRQRRALGRNSFSREDVERVVRRSFAEARRHTRGDQARLTALTVHAAKNREFDLVIVLWPAATRGTDDQKRRLLYNAITRARNRCLVLVQAQVSLRSAPFS